MDIVEIVADINVRNTTSAAMKVVSYLNVGKMKLK